MQQRQIGQLPSHTRIRKGEFLARDGFETWRKLKAQKMAEGKAYCALAVTVDVLPLDFHVRTVPQDALDHGGHLGRRATLQL